MKKILILVLVLSGISLAQYAPAKKDVKFPYYYTHMINGEYLAPMVYNVGAGSDASTPSYTVPYLAYLRSTDTWGAASDTSTYAFANAYLKAYVTVYDTSATADTLVFEHYSYAKNAYTTQAIGIRDILTDYLEADNSTIIIAGATAKTFEVNMFRPGTLRIRPKTITGRTTVKTKRVVWVGVN